MTEHYPRATRFRRGRRRRLRQRARIDGSDAQAAEQLLPLVYDELRKLAAARMAQESPGHTLQATALVHDAYIRLVSPNDRQKWDGRGHFFAAAAEAMRRILVERARRKGVMQRKGLRNRVELSDYSENPSTSFDILSFDTALSELAKHDSQAAELVKLRFFVGLTHQEAAKSIKVTRRVADRLWRVARAWISREMSRGSQCDPFFS